MEEEAFRRFLGKRDQLSKRLGRCRGLRNSQHLPIRRPLPGSAYEQD